MRKPWEIEAELALDDLDYEPQAFSDLGFLTLGDFDMSPERFLPTDAAFDGEFPPPFSPFRGHGPKGPAQAFRKGGKKNMKNANRRGRNLRHGGFKNMLNRHNDDVGEY